MTKEEFRNKIKELVTYILNPKERDEDVIENYTDAVMLACEEYHIEKLKLQGVRESLPLTEGKTKSNVKKHKISKQAPPPPPVRTIKGNL